VQSTFNPLFSVLFRAIREEKLKLISCVSSIAIFRDQIGRLRFKIVGIFFSFFFCFLRLYLGFKLKQFMSGPLVKSMQYYWYILQWTKIMHCYSVSTVPSIYSFILFDSSTPKFLTTYRLKYR
jgi:hypothetical protein